MLAIWGTISLAKTRVACTCEYCSKFQASYLHSSKCGGKFVSMFPTIYRGCALGDSKEFTVHRSNLWLCELNYLSCVFTLYNKDVIMWQKLSSHFYVQEFCEEAHLDCRIPIGFIIEIQDFFILFCLTISLNQNNEYVMPFLMNWRCIIVPTYSNHIFWL